MVGAVFCDFATKNSLHFRWPRGGAGAGGGGGGGHINVLNVPFNDATLLIFLC